MRLALLLAASLFATQALAQQQTQQQYQPTQPGVQVDADRDRGVNVDIRTGDDARRADTDRRARADRSAAHSKTMRVSELTGTTVRNEANENIGSINDVVIDLESGDIAYVAVAVGGVLGVGADMYAVPFEALDCRRDGDDKVVIWRIDPQTLENAQGFDTNNWPDEADRQFDARDRQRVGQRPTDRQTPRPIQPGQQQRLEQQHQLEQQQRPEQQQQQQQRPIPQQ